MSEANNELIKKDILQKFPTSEKNIPKHIKIIEKFHIMGNSVEDKSTKDKTEKVVLQGTQEKTIHPDVKPFILRSGARASCDASLLLEVADDGTAHAAVTHWEPTEPERNAHTETVSRLIEQPAIGKRFAVLVSGTIEDLQKAEETGLYQKMTQWNSGRKPDLVYIPFEGIDWSKIARETLYQLVLAVKVENGEPQFEISVPGTEYTRTFMPQTLPEVTNQITAIRHKA